MNYKLKQIFEEILAEATGSIVEYLNKNIDDICATEALNAM